jgi:hypothetical protein
MRARSATVKAWVACAWVSSSTRMWRVEVCSSRVHAKLHFKFELAFQNTQ